MSNFVPSPFQAAVFEWIQTGKGSAFVEAVAGSGKTTTLVECCKLFSKDLQVAFVAFNKAIVKEIEERLAQAGLNHITACTMHSAGFKAVRSAYRGVQCDDRKKQQTLIDQVGIPAQWQAFVFAAVSQAKNRAMGEDEIGQVELWHDIVSHFDLADKIENPEDIEKAIMVAQDTLRASIKLSVRLINFDDMIYMPVVMGMNVWQYDWVLTDEAQDTNECRRRLLRMMLKPEGRSIWVGDRHQSIYGFTGADAEAVEKIISEFNCTLLPLTVSYRCPKAVVKMANTIVSHITAHENAPEGKVETIDATKLFDQNLVKTDAILCRKTAPIVELAFKLIRQNIACHVEGRDIGQGLIKLATRWKIKNVSQLLDRLEAYRAREVAKFMAKGQEEKAEALQDRVETLVVLAAGCDTIDCIKAKIERMFSDTDPKGRPDNLTLATMHRSKGREWPRVFLFGYNQWCPSKYARQGWQMAQEANLQYVGITRAKEHLVVVDVIKERGAA